MRAPVEEQMHSVSSQDRRVSGFLDRTTTDAGAAGDERQIVATRALPNLGYLDRPVHLPIPTD
jgi:hypothetical protein